MSFTKLTDRNQSLDRPALAKYLPYVDITDGYLIKKNGNFVAGFELLAHDNMGMSAENYLALGASLENVLNQVDEGVNLQFLYSFDYYPYKKDYVYADDNTLNTFKFRRHQYYSFYKYLTCRMFLFVDFDAGKTTRTPYNILMSTSTIVQRLAEEHRRLALTRQNELKGLYSNFRSTGVQLRRLNNAELADVAFKAINLTSDDLQTTPNSMALNNALAVADFQVDRGYLKVGNQYVACLSLSLLPEVTRQFYKYNGIPLPYLFPLLHNLSFPHRVVLSTQNLDMEQETARLSRQLNLTRFITNFSRNREGRKSEVKYRELNDLMDEIYNQHKKLASISLSVLLWDADIDKLNQKITQANLAFGAVDKAQAVLETLDVLPIFMSCLPGNSAENYHRLMVKTSNAANFITLTNFNKGYHQGILMKNRHNEPVLFDYFDQNLNSWNSIIIGPTGTGKSYLMQSMLLQMLEQGVKVFGLDVGGVGETGGSYKKMVQLLNGRYVELNIDKPIPLNPFALIGDNFDTKKQLFLRKKKKKLLLERDQTSLSKIEQGFISKVLEKYVKEFHGSRNLTTFVNFFVKQVDPEGYVDTRLMARKMYMYTHGEYSRFLCADEMIEINEDLVCFDLKGLETHPDLQGIIAIIITGLLWDLMERNLGHHKVIFADELWKVLDDSSTIGHLVVELFRTARKMGAGIFAISQSIDDIEKVSFSTPIKDNALNHFILGHKSKQMDALTRAFGYGEREQALVASLDRGEFMLDRDGRMTVMRADMSLFDHYLFTSDRQENNVLEKKIHESSGNLVKAITEIVREKESAHEASPYFL